MNVIYRICISLAIGLVFSSLYSGYIATGAAHFLFDPAAFAAFSLATLMTTFLLGFFPQPSVNNNAPQEDSSQQSDHPAPTGNRERGRVKWFNFSKGFGFINRDNGDEIFVHYRSIQGKGRRSLNEGQSVEFTVTESEKGLQAEEVEIISKD